MFNQTIECLSSSLRNERTKKEAQHLLSFSFLHTNQHEAALSSFHKSVLFGNDSDWQMLVELLMDYPNLKIC